MKSNIKCLKCGYEWNTKSQLRYVTCPSCLYKNLRENKEELDNGMEY